MAWKISTGSDSKVQIPIPPMLDMTFQLLLFAMLWFRPSSLEGQMDLTLPTEKPKVSQDNVSKPLDNEVGETEDELKTPPEVTVIVKANVGDDPVLAGQISQISVQLQEGATPIQQEGATTEQLMAMLTEHLKKVRETLGNKTDVMMKADRKLKWQNVVKVRDACQKAEFTNAHFSPPPDL
jgi:biopolymer transport protein ExbD